jgi:hypothetical protein
MALRDNKAVQDVDSQQLKAKLKEQGAVMENRPPVTGPAFFHGLWQKFHPEELRTRTLP